MPLYIDRWLERAEPDFYMMFVSTWIPFNAWYKNDISPLTQSGSDAQCISYICSHNNKYKDRLLYYLRDNGKEGDWMRNQVAMLQRMLTLHPIPDAANPLNFSTICVESNVTNLFECDFRHCHYKWEHVAHPAAGHKKFQCTVVDTHVAPPVTKLMLELDKWDISELTSNPDFTAIASQEMKNKVREYFYEINPRKPLNVIHPSHPDAHGVYKKPAHSCSYDSIEPPVFFSDNVEDVAKVLINLIYKLRCEIFHGSLDPDKNNKEVYEYAYNIQRQLIKALV